MGDDHEFWDFAWPARSRIIRPYGTRSLVYRMIPALKCRANFMASLRDAAWDFIDDLAA